MPTTMSPSGAATENRSEAALTATAIATSVTSVSATSTLLFNYVGVVAFPTTLTDVTSGSDAGGLHVATQLGRQGEREALLGGADGVGVGVAVFGEVGEHVL